MAAEDDDLYAHAWLLAGMERWHDVLDVLREGDPNDVRTFAARGMAMLYLGRIADAQRELRRGLELDPEHVVSLMLLAQAQARRDAAAAEDTLQKALALDPENPMLLQTHVQILMEQGRYEAAEHVLARAMQIAPEQMQHTRTVFLMRACGSREALEAAEELLGETPDDAAAHYLRGLALLNRGRASEGMRHLREAAGLRPADPLFSAAARLFNAWYLWPVHVTGGVVHYLLATVFLIVSLAVLVLAQDFSLFWKTLAPWLAFVAYKWVATGVTLLRLRLHVR